ncbi:formate dehydrogenase, gamma subunit, putative [alpha proteobacterium BAL199]|jgi:formate dehydrogenase subunit gamma|nr:formate dehydrogenase, gamma subunit, putative [alpha proteobacterium BAL199]
MAMIARRIATVLALLAVLVTASVAVMHTPAIAQTDGKVPGETLGTSSDADFWRQIRQGTQGQVSIPNNQSGVLIQSEGDNWRSVRNGPVSTYGAWALLGAVIAVAAFFAIRGRIRIHGGPSGVTIERFKAVERFAHWLMAGSFVILGLTGLNILYGRYVLKPVIGPDAFGALTLFGKYAHNYLAFAFMIGLVLAFVLWVAHNLPHKSDLVWLAKGGGMIGSAHPPARKFNAGQKILFWLVMLGGLSISMSGISLMFPFELPLFAKTFAVLNLVGFDLPTSLTAMQEMQLGQLWHTIMAVFLIAVIIAHIYIGSLGMEGAFDAMGTGQVDVNWAREHHSLWAEEVEEGEAARRHSAAE